LGTVTSATAQQTADIVGETTFSSMQDASRAAKANGMILARSFHGEMRFITDEMAELLKSQGFEYGANNVLFGWSQGSFLDALKDTLTGDGHHFPQDLESFTSGSIRITVEGAR
jgi:hypothetical protein